MEKEADFSNDGFYLHCEVCFINYLSTMLACPFCKEEEEEEVPQLIPIAPLVGVDYLEKEAAYFNDELSVAPSTVIDEDDQVSLMN